MADFNPQHGCPASLKLFGHVIQKGFEAGGLIGGALVVPGTAAYTTYVKKQKVDVLELAQNAAFSCLAGVGLSGECGERVETWHSCRKADDLVNSKVSECTST